MEKTNTDITTKAAVFFAHLTNAYRDEENQDCPMQLHVSDDGDFTSDLTAMLIAINFIFERVCPEAAKGMDMIDFTHMLNRLAIQFCYGEKGADANGDAETVQD